MVKYKIEYGLGKEGEHGGGGASGGQQEGLVLGNEEGDLGKECGFGGLAAGMNRGRGGLGSVVCAPEPGSSLASLQPKR